MEPSMVIDASIIGEAFAGRKSSSVFPRFSFRWWVDIHAEMSARHAEVRAGTWVSDGEKERNSWFRRKRQQKDVSHSNSARTPGSSNSSSSSPSSSTSIASTSTSSSLLPPSGAPRWSRAFDVCVCHSAGDAPDALLLATRLETGGLRCFLPLRDSTPGAAVSTELLEAVSGAHCWALLITPHFLADPWCRYQMHQALAEAPTSSRIIPLLLRASRAQYPPELRFYYYIDLGGDAERGYARVHTAVLNYLEEICRSTVMAADAVPGHARQGDLEPSGQMLMDRGFSKTSSFSVPPISGELFSTELGEAETDTVEEDIAAEMDPSP
ncbi:hypothetical protein AAFF_G00397530 [Aldrovandia affinis]|uniref:TIR domain-containing protein n=1 Tax=Aldrovandia affinis TaxID=143900 RepID=A0AAD7SD25_9TELE|nr:hypothetical protein AAFF_G00397530 [Aldrovandia affinis]